MSLAKYLWTMPPIPIVEFVAATTASNATTIDVPAGAKTGDLMVLVVGTNQAYVLPPDFTSAHNDSDRVLVAHKAFAGETTLTVSTGGAPTQMAATLAVFRNATWGASSDGSASGLFPSVSGFAFGGMALAVGGAFYASLTERISAPAGYAVAGESFYSVGTARFEADVFYKPVDIGSEQPSDTFLTGTTNEIVATVRLDAPE
jgi:hypothetical protein